MTAEEAELTFIRCPSCRSLIPAIATRCRMCGHQFEKAGAAGGTSQTEDPQQRSRVRQRSASASVADFESVKSQAAAAQAAEAAANAALQAAAPEPEPEPEEAPAPKLASWKEFVSTDEPVADEDIDTTFLEESRSPAKKPERTPTNVLSRDEGSADEEASDPSESYGWDESEEGADEDDFEGESEGDAANLSGSQEGSRKKRRRRRKKRRGGNGVAPEAGTNGSLLGSSVGSGLGTSSYGESREISTQASASSPVPPPIVPPTAPSAPFFAPPPPPPASESPSAVAAPRESVSQASALQSSVSSAASAAASAYQARPVVQEPVAPVQSSTRREEPSRAAQGRGSEEHVTGEGMLVGWLVSFREEQQGKAIEIRAGRRFVGRGHLRGADIVFGHDSVSTPHGMLVSSEVDGMSFQDLMSERGTYVLRNGGKVSDWTQVTNSVTLNHGDRIRFGDYEVLVVLLPK